MLYKSSTALVVRGTTYIELQRRATALSVSDSAVVAKLVQDRSEWLTRREHALFKEVRVLVCRFKAWFVRIV